MKHMYWKLAQLNIDKQGAILNKYCMINNFIDLKLGAPCHFKIALELGEILDVFYVKN